VNYIGKLQNGKIFDSNVGQRPFKFRLGNISKHVFELFLHLKQEIHNQIAKTKIKETNHTLFEIPYKNRPQWLAILSSHALKSFQFCIVLHGGYYLSVYLYTKLHICAFYSVIVPDIYQQINI
jgi:hypothetical protein